MTNKFKDDFTIENLNESPERSFSPLRTIIKYDDLYDLFVNNEFSHEGELEALIEIFFSWNEIFPQGLKGKLNMDFGKTFAFLDTYQVLLSFIVSNLKEGKYKETFEDIRMSMQNFLVYITIGSYISAFCEYRKMIEGSIWIKYLSENDFPEDDRVDLETNYSERLKDKPNLLKYFSISSKLIHAKKIFNFNSWDGKEYHLPEFQTNIQNCYKELKESLELIFEIDFIKENLIMKKFQKLYLKIEKIRETYKLSDHPVEEEIEYDLIKDFNLFEGIKYSNKKFEIRKFILSYESNLAYLIKTTNTKWNQNVKNFTEEETFAQFTSVKQALIRISKKIENQKLENSANLFNIERPLLQTIIENVKCENNRKIYKIYLNKFSNIAKELIEKEIEKPYSYFTQVRMIIEDIIFNTIYGKPSSVILFNVLIETFRKIDKTIEYKEITKYRHIRPTERTMSRNDEGKTTGEVDGKEIIEKIIELSEKFIEKIKK